MERITTLDPEPASVGTARRFVVAALTESGRVSDGDIVELLVSELVTNAVLHARSRVVLSVHVEGEILRIEVRDTEPTLPTARVHDQESQTGRGLELVDLLSNRWGAELDAPSSSGPQGKTVWFELMSAPDLAAPPWESQGQETDLVSDTVGLLHPVCLEGIPLALYRASQEHGEGLIREFLLMAIGDTNTDIDTVPARLVLLSEELTERLAGESASVRAQVVDAEKHGDERIDLVMKLPQEAAAMLAGIVELMEEADRYCADGALLTLEAPAEVRRFRRWCVGEIAAQLGGEASSRWQDR